MIDWQIIKNEKENISDEGWYFPTFAIQEYLLPMINVGFAFIDEYSDTKFSIEDCKRLIGNIDYILDSGIRNNRSTIKFESFSGELLDLNTKEIIACLQKLHHAANKVISMKAQLVFLGD